MRSLVCLHSSYHLKVVTHLDNLQVGSDSGLPVVALATHKHDVAD